VKEAANLAVRPVKNLAKNISHDAGTIVEGAENAVVGVVEKIELPHDKLSLGKQLWSGAKRLAMAVKGTSRSFEDNLSIANRAGFAGDLRTAHRYYNKALAQTKTASDALWTLALMSENTCPFDYEFKTPGLINMVKKCLAEAAKKVETPEELKSLLEYNVLTSHMIDSWRPSMDAFGYHPSIFSNFISLVIAVASLGTVPTVQKAAMRDSIDKISDLAILNAARKARDVEAAKKIAKYARIFRYHAAGEVALQKAAGLAEHTGSRGGGPQHF
ncbi:MAG: hypothetical protein HY692_00280, partial [Cyanobacteria bacterium NC_groundwater_1444_Ag_S-0.65um_54_12]|nr:hypothetical protein [Cyanobacteria bacterium NC_groundwater_1444_Ag_S-0.65um_54_12]